jgi:hypothetical protein
MIKFPCHCGHPFELSDDMAGGLIQCPKCGRLNDVPTLDELKHLDADGTIRLDDYQVKPQPIRTAELHRYYSKDKIDEQGNELDLRSSLEELRQVGNEPIPLEEEEPQRAPAPKYDPVTGELIRPLDLVHDPIADTRPADIPMAQTTLNYATLHLTQKVSVLSAPLLSMFRLVNVAAMLFVLVAHLLILLCLFILNYNILVLFIIWIPLAVIGCLIAHYANVVEDIGPDQKDELPRFMRDFSAQDDILRPMFNVFLAFLYCYGPIIAVVLFMNGPSYLKSLLCVGYAILGTIIFPAVFLITTTSGSIHNLRPDRVWRTIGVIGVKYLFLLLMGIIAISVYSFGILTTAVHSLIFLELSRQSVMVRFAFIGYLFLLAGIVLMHYWSWMLGLIYRQKQPLFPWVFQQHTREANRYLGPRSKSKPAPRLPLPSGTPRSAGAPRYAPTPRPVRNANIEISDSFDGKI